jgi:SAM-dependent methyltransferase
MKMKVFRRYADFYDSLYEDKNYRDECNFIKHVFETYSEKEVNSILDLGCGTGSHALPFADMGYSVTGVDLSENMLEIARKKAAEQKKRVAFVQQDIKHLKLPQKFDAAVAMFAVMGYQTTNEDFEDTLISVHRHLNTGGLFIFDVWFGPAVLTQKPADRVKIIEQKDKKIIRYAHPVLNIMNHTVEVDYTVLEIAGDKVLTETKESHLMRFFFYQELKYFLEKNGFEVLKICPFMDLDERVDESCWNASVVCKK